MASKNQQLLEAFIQALSQDLADAYKLGLTLDEAATAYLIFAATIAQTDLHMDPHQFLAFCSTCWNDRAQRTGGAEIVLHDSVEDMEEAMSEEDTKKDPVN